MPAAFDEFRDCLLRHAAESFARIGAVQQLEKLLQEHAFALVPGLLEILESLPEVMAPSDFEHLLPKVATLRERPAAFSIQAAPWQIANRMLDSALTKLILCILCF